MPLSMFADPDAAGAVTPPNQAEFDAIDDYLTAQAVISDPFGSGLDAVIDRSDGQTSLPSSSSSSSWTEPFVGIGKSFAQAFGSSLGSNLGGRTAAQHIATQQANSNAQLYWIVGGVGVAVVLGAVLLRRGRR